MKLTEAQLQEIRDTNLVSIGKAHPLWKLYNHIEASKNEGGSEYHVAEVARLKSVVNQLQSSIDGLKEVNEELLATIEEKEARIEELEEELTSPTEEEIEAEADEAADSLSDFDQPEDEDGDEDETDEAELPPLSKRLGEGISRTEDNPSSGRSWS